MIARPLVRALAALSFVVLGSAGCASPSVDEGRSAPPPPPPPTPPHITSIVVPTWPPLGASSHVDVHLTDDEALSHATATFRGVTRREVDGTSDVVRFTGLELGEGMGTLKIVACDERLACRERRVTDLLVDMSPPEIELESAEVSPRLDGIEGQLAVWVADAWVLGMVEVTFKGKSLRHDFPHAYPATLGEDWDVSRVAFAAKDLPEGEGDALVVARDAAGNMRTGTFRVRIDGKLPTVAIAEPRDGADVSGDLRVAVTAFDDGPRPPLVEVWVGGARVLEAVAPLAPVVVDTSSLTPGPTEIRAVARDAAGNRSVVAKRTVNVTR